MLPTSPILAPHAHADSVLLPLALSVVLGGHPYLVPMHGTSMPAAHLGALGASNPAAMTAPPQHVPTQHADLQPESYEIPRHLPQRWLLLLAQLDPRQREFTPTDLAPLLNISRVTVRETMQELWPTRCGHYRLSYCEAALVLATRDGGARKATPHLDLYIESRQLGRITAQFPDDVPHLLKARDWVWAEQERREIAWAERETRDKAQRATRLIATRR